MKIYCPQCEAENPEDAPLCGLCGHLLNATAPMAGLSEAARKKEAAPLQVIQKQTTMSDETLLTTKPDFRPTKVVGTAIVAVELVVGIVVGIVGGQTMNALIATGCAVAVTLCLIGGHWWRCFVTTLTITADRTILRTGRLDKTTTEVRHKDVRAMTINEPLFDRLFGLGSIEIYSAGHAGVEITVTGIPNPERIRKLIDEHRD